MNKLDDLLRKELDSSVQKWFLANSSIKVRNKDKTIDTTDTQQLDIIVDSIEIPVDEILEASRFQKDITAKIEFLELIEDGGKTLAQIEVTFQNTVITYNQKEKNFSIKLGVEFCRELN